MQSSEELKTLQLMTMKGPYYPRQMLVEKIKYLCTISNLIFTQFHIETHPLIERI